MNTRLLDSDMRDLFPPGPWYATRISTLRVLIRPVFNRLSEAARAKFHAMTD